MHKKRPALLGAAAILAAFTTGTHAAGDFMHTAGRTAQPIGHYEFCERKPDECGPTAYSGPVEMTRDLWALLIEVNNSVNTTVIPRTDMEMWGVEEYWSYPDRYGDCEDYALEKRRLLNEAGIPLGNLLITVALQPNGDGHAVLTVNTTMGDFILDNLEPRVLHWTETEYEYLKRQSELHAGRWMGIDDGRAIAVGSVAAR